MCKSRSSLSLSSLTTSAAKVGFTFFLLVVHTHGDEHSYTLPEWFVQDRKVEGGDSRGRYGALGDRD